MCVNDILREAVNYVLGVCEKTMAKIRHFRLLNRNRSSGFAWPHGLILTNDADGDDTALDHFINEYFSTSSNDQYVNLLLLLFNVLLNIDI